jgi:hypothetical protein
MALEDRAIVVGISKYPDLGDLNGPENDAQEFYNWVVSSGGVAPANAKLILSSKVVPPPPFASALTAEPSDTAIYREIAWLNGIAAENDDAGLGLRVGKRLYLYFAGHGFGPRLEEAAILMANANKKARAWHHIPGRPNALRFLEEGLFEEVILLMDCCREVQRRIALANLPFEEQRVPIPDITKRFFGYSCKHAELSKERVINGETHGVFSVAVMAGLRGSAAVNGKITAASLGSYVYDNMKKLLEEGDLTDDRIAKEPDLDYDTQVGQQFVISTIGAPVPGAGSSADPTFPVTINFTPVRYGRPIELLDNRFAVVGKTTAGPAPWTVSLHRAIYALVDGPERKTIEIPGIGPFNDTF